MEFFECVLGRRTCRRFKQDPISREDLDKMIDAGRYAPTGYNKQSVRYVIVNSPEKVAETFKFTGWLTGTPAEDEQPTAYVFVMNDTTIGDGQTAVACAAYAIILAAHTMGYSACWHSCITREGVREFLALPESINPRIVISLGKPAEKVIVHDPSTEWKPRKDDDGVIHLGKLSRDDVTLNVM